MVSRITRIIGVRKAIDQFVGAGVAEFTANQALQIGVIGLQALGTSREAGVVGDEAIAGSLQLGPMAPEESEVTGTERGGDTANHHRDQNGAED